MCKDRGFGIDPSYIRTITGAKGLEFLAKHEMELAAAAASVDLVEAVTPVNSEHSQHLEVDSHTDSGGPLHIEGGEFLHRSPTVAGLGECQGIDGCRRLQHEGEMKFHHEAAVGVSLFAPGCELAVVIAAHGHSLSGIGITSRHAVATEIECLEGCFDIFVVGTEQCEVGAGHQYKGPLSVGVCERSESLAFEFHFPIFYPFVELGFSRLLVQFKCLIGQLFPIFVGLEKGNGGCEHHIEGELRTPAGINGVVDAGAREVESECQGIGGAVVHVIEVIPVFEVIPSIGQRCLECEIVIGPCKACAETHLDACHLEHLVGVVGVLIGVLVEVAVVGAAVV